MEMRTEQNRLTDEWSCLTVWKWKRPTWLLELKEMTEMFSQYDQRQQAQSAPGWFVTHSAKLCPLFLQNFPLSSGHTGKANKCMLLSLYIAFHYRELLSVCGGIGSIPLWPLIGIALMDGWMDDSQTNTVTYLIGFTQVSEFVFTPPFLS